MASVEDILLTFHGNTSSWHTVMRLAAGVSWEGWETDSSAFRSVAKIPEAVASKILSLSKEIGADLDRVLRNAIATAPQEELPLARLVTVVLLRDGLLTESDAPWLAAFPSPSPFDVFLSDRICGRFAPSAEVFACLVRALDDDRSQVAAINNLLRSLAPITGSAKQLFDRLLKSGLPASTPAKLLLPAIARRAQKEPLEADMESSSLALLPQDWRSSILVETKYSRLFLMLATIARIKSDPIAFPFTPETIKSVDLRNNLAKELAAGRLSGHLLSSLLEGRSICEAIERDFDWTVLKGVTTTIKLDRHKGAIPSLNEFRYRTDSGKLFSNLAAIALSGKPEIFLPKRAADIAVAKQLMVQVDRDVLKFSIETCSGEAQLFFLQCVLSDEVDEGLQNFAVKTFFATLNGAEVRPRTLNAVLPWASTEQRELGFRTAFARIELCAALLVWNSSYREWFLGRITQGDVPNYTSSLDLFRALNSLGEDGARIVDALLAQLVGNSKSQRSMLVRTLQYAPSLTQHIFRGRQIRLDDFLGLILSPSFLEIGEDDQAAILALRCRRGKSALQLAYESGRLTSDFLDWLSTQGALTRSVAQNAPELLAQGELPLPDLLVGLTRQPSKATKLLAGIDRSDLIGALPEALSLLHDRPRIAAALELAVRSDVAALPQFMRLATRLAPPFEKSNFGHRFDDLYSVYEIPKRSGGVRTISAPAAHLKSAQRALLKLLYEEVISDQAMGFVPGRSIRDNAARHVGQEIVVNVDVRAFFPSTGYKRVYGAARKLCGGQLSSLSVRLFSEICCHAGHLATGAPTSPTVSNLILRDLDAQLDRIAGRLGVSYSRYADDLTFSGRDAAVWMLKPAKTFLTGLGYELDPKKTNVFRKGRRQIVTGAVVNEKVNLARTLRKGLRAAVDYRVRGKQPFLQERPLTDAMLNGHLSYLKMLSPESAAPLLKKVKGAAGWPY
jgi:retron-type reverse transcriptase